MRVPGAGLLAVAWLSSLAVSSPIVFEDSPPSRGDIQQQGANRGSLQPIPGSAGAEGEGRIFHKKKKKKKKVICSIAGLIAGRDATGAVDQAAGRAEHRAARAVPQGGPHGDPQGGHHGAPQGPVPGDAGAQGRGLPPGTGFAGFLLGALVGSHLVSSYAAGPGVAYPHGPPVATQTQVQVQAPVVPVPAPVPVRPPVVNPAPVHEDYDEVEDDPVVGGGGGYSICDQLQHRPEAGPLDSHFPLIAGILSGGGGGGHQLPYRPPQHSPYGGYGGYAKPGGGLLYHYFKPWTDLFFK